MTAINTSFIIHDGQAWFDAYTVTNAASSAKAEADEYWRNAIAELQTAKDRRIKELVVESNNMHAQWYAAEQRATKLDRAEEAMREYEQTIGEQAKEIESLKREVAARALPKRKPSNQNKLLKSL